jgi:citrate synthase
MQPFWRTEPLNPAELELLDALSEAHNKSTFRQCPSTIALQCAAQGSGSLYQSLAAALVAFGGRHGPVEQTYELLESAYACETLVNDLLAKGEKIPGWGSSFVQSGQGDPHWHQVDQVLIHYFEPFRWRMTKFTDALHTRGRMILPNPSAYTALTAIIVGMPKRLSPYLLIMGRLSAWAEIFLNETKGE